MWGGELGWTSFAQGVIDTNVGATTTATALRWRPGGGIKPGLQLWEADDFSYNAVTPVEIHDPHCRTSWESMVKSRRVAFSAAISG